ncbi:MAG: BatA domain-containing protein [Verrucomicrobiota bacterium]
MNFLSPNFLWGLLAAVPLIAVYFLKVRPRRRQVTAFFLWQQVFEKRKASSLFQRLRNALSLILMLFTLVAAVLAAAGLRLQKSDERDLVVIIDASPSMHASVNGKSLIAQARITTRDWIKALNGTRRIAIALAANDLHFLSHLSESPRDLLEATDLITVTDLPITPATVEAVNAAAAHAAAHTRFVLMTDGNRGWEGLAPNIEVVRLSDKALPNAGFIAADIEWSGIAGRQARFFYQVASSYPGGKYVELELRNEDDPSFLRILPLNLKPGEATATTLDVDAAQPGRWSARLLGGDAFPDDDQVALGLAPRMPVRVAIPATDSYFFQRCVESFQAASGALTLVTTAPDVVLAKGSAPPAANASLIFAPQGDSPFWKSIGKPIEVLLPEVKSPGHPVLKNLDFDALRFEGARAIVPPEGSLILATAESGMPLIWQSTVSNKTAVVVNLDPNEGEFFLSPWFPVIVHNAATHLAGRASPTRAVFATGSVVTLPGVLISPAGANLSDPQVVLNQRGHWRTSTGEWFGAAILSESETVLDAKGPAASAKPIERGYPLLVWLLILSLGLLAGEMLLYHRRKVG